MQMNLEAAGSDSALIARRVHTSSARRSLFSLTPCFSWVFGSRNDPNRFNGFHQTVETVETVPSSIQALITQLKQGVNERPVEWRRKVCDISGLERKGNSPEE